MPEADRLVKSGQVPATDEIRCLSAGDDMKVACARPRWTHWVTNRGLPRRAAYLWLKRSNLDPTILKSIDYRNA